MAASEYRSMNATLALQLATHAAFDLNLAIVGMSLQDAYLREQLTAFRDQIKDVFYFTAETPARPVAEWAWRNNVRVVESSWNEFWPTIVRLLPGPEELPLRWAWSHALNHAVECLANPTTRGANALLHSFGVRPEQILQLYIDANLKGEIVELNPQPFVFSNVPPSIQEFMKETMRMESNNA